MYVTAARQLDEITITEPVGAYTRNGWPTEVQPGTYPAIRDPALQATDGDLVCIDLATGDEDDPIDGIPTYVSVHDGGTVRVSTLDIAGVFESMAQR